MTQWTDPHSPKLRAMKEIMYGLQSDLDFYHRRLLDHPESSPWWEYYSEKKRILGSLLEILNPKSEATIGAGEAEQANLPRANKFLSDYQEQLKSKKKRRKSWMTLERLQDIMESLKFQGEYPTRVISSKEFYEDVHSSWPPLDPKNGRVVFDGGILYSGRVHLVWLQCIKPPFGIAEYKSWGLKEVTLS
jgi:hypothetical protein